MEEKRPRAKMVLMMDAGNSLGAFIVEVVAEVEAAGRFAAGARKGATVNSKLLAARLLLRQLLAEEVAQLQTESVPDLAKFRPGLLLASFGLAWIGEAQGVPLDSAEVEGAVFLRLGAQGDNVIKGFPLIVAEAVGSLQCKMDPEFGHDSDSLGMKALRGQSCRDGLQAVAEVEINQGGSHGAETGVVAAEKQGALFHADLRFLLLVSAIDTFVKSDLFRLGKFTLTGF
jgi:hypothetical protein